MIAIYRVDMPFFDHTKKCAKMAVKLITHLLGLCGIAGKNDGGKLVGDGFIQTQSFNSYLI